MEHQALSDFYLLKTPPVPSVASSTRHPVSIERAGLVILMIVPAGYKMVTDAWQGREPFKRDTGPWQMATKETGGVFSQ